MPILALSGYAGSGKDTAAACIQNLTRTQSKLTAIDKRGMGVATLGPSPWKIKKFADPLRQVAAILLGMPIDCLYSDEFKTDVLPGEWAIYKARLNTSGREHKITKAGYLQLLPDNSHAVSRTAMTGRQFLQLLGTNAIRDNLHEDAWVNALMNQYLPLKKEVKERWRGHAINIGDETVEYPKWIITDLRFPNEMHAVKERNGVTIRIHRSAKASDVVLHESETALDNANFDFHVLNTGTIEDLTENLKSILQQLNIITNE